MLLQKSLQGKNFLILGYGKSGQSACKLLKKIAKNIFIYDKKNIVKILSNENNLFFINSIPKLLKTQKIHYVIVSPGFSIFCKEIKQLKENKIRLISELELGAMFCKGKIFAITGTNGKTTTVSALHHIFLTARKQSFLCGNVGIPITEIAQKTTNKSLIVCEVSSFQMETTKNFFPYASAILNLKPDHLDRHKNFSNYIYCKNKINKYFKTIKCFNFDDNTTNIISNNFNKKILFSIKNNKNKLIFNYFLINLIKNNNLLGEFNYSNLLCAAILAKTINIQNTVIKKAVSTFYPPNHRLKFLTKFQNISFINDSKSTNIASTTSAIKAIKNKIILLLGGSDKNLCFDELNKYNYIAIIGYGETKNKIQKSFINFNNFYKENNLQNAFCKAINIANLTTENVNILLSPACASFDEFTSYAQRGEFFEKLVFNYVKQHS